MPRISSNRPAPRPAADRAPAVKAETRKQLKATFEKLVKGNLDFNKAPEGGKFVRVPLKAGKTDQYSYTALIPTGAKSKDPNKAEGFLLERSGGLAGLTQVAGPFTFEGKKLGKASPFFEKFLEGQKNGGVQPMTKRYPSDDESVDKPGKPGSLVTERYPSDNESIDTKPTKPGHAVTMRYPSDNESIDSKPTKPGNNVVTERYPSDNESIDKPTKPGGTVTTMAYPSDNETIDKPTKPGGTVTTMAYPSDNETIDKPTKPGNNVVTERYPSDNESIDKPTRPGGTVTTMRYPSDNEDGGVR